MRDDGPTPAADRRLTQQLAAVAEPTRLRIVRLLAGGPRSVGEIAAGVGPTWSTCRTTCG